MSTFYNKKDGTLEPISTNTQIIDQPANHFLSKEAYDPDGVVEDAGGIEAVAVPTGGTTGQVLTKKSNSDYDTEWQDAPRYNVLDYGLVADGVTDNSTAFADMIASIPDARTKAVVIYFPAGQYLFTQPITINLGGLTLMGDTVANKEYAGGGATLGWANPDSILIYDGDANTTFIKGSDRMWFLNLYGLHFDCPNGFSMTKNTDDFDGTLPYPLFNTSVNKDGIIGVGLTNGLSVDKCIFSGFSGAGFEAHIHTIINETSFYKCKIGADVEYDTMIKDCWFNYCELAVNIRPSDNSEWSWTTFMIADTWIDQGKRALYSTARETMIIASNIHFDMMDEAAIVCTQRLVNSRIEGRISRAGMMYAGISDADRTTAIAPYSDAIVADNILYTKIDVTSQKRNIGQGKNKNAVCASRLVTSLSGRMTRSDIKDYSITFADVYDPSMITQFYDTNFHVRDKECTNTDAKIFTYAKIYYNAGSPIGVVKPLSQTCLCIDTTNKVWYRSTGANNTDWVVDNASIPTGGTAGQVLTKKSNSDYDAEWKTAEDVLYPYVDTPFVMNEKVYINKSGRKVTTQGAQWKCSNPIAVTRGQNIKFTASGFETNLAMIATCDIEGNDISVKVVSEQNPSGGSFYYKIYEYEVTDDGYIVLSCNTQGGEPSLQIKNGVLNANSLISETTFTTLCHAFKKVVCVGDSYTEGRIHKTTDESYVDDPNYSWVHYMNDLTGNEWINCGASGATAKLWQTNNKGLPKAQAEGVVQAYVIGLGINDSSSESYGLPVGTESDIGTNNDTYYAQLSKVIVELATISPNAYIFVNTCPFFNVDRITPYNVAIRAIVEHFKGTYKIHCIDLANEYAYLFYAPNFTAMFYNGHPTVDGYAAIAKKYEFALSNYMKQHEANFRDIPWTPYGT